jgi:hypothetical protein
MVGIALAASCHLMMRLAIWSRAQSAGNCELKMLPDASRSRQALSNASLMARVVSESKEFLDMMNGAHGALPMCGLLGIPGGSATISQSPVAYDCLFLPVMN